MMAHTEKMTGIPKDKVQEIRSSYEMEGAKVISVTEEADGTFSIVISFPDRAEDAHSFRTPVAKI